MDKPGEHYAERNKMPKDKYYKISCVESNTVIFIDTESKNGDCQVPGAGDKRNMS